jgi:hypothetical protein
MLIVLRQAARGEPLGHHLSGRSEHGGFSGTRLALVRHGLLAADHSLTEAGRAALARADRSTA